MHAKCLIAEPIAKNDENICCNYVVVPDFVPIVCSTSKEKSMLERKAFKPKPLFRSHHMELSGFKFVPTCHHCGVIGHIRLQCSMLKKVQNHSAKSLPKNPSGPKPIVYYHCDVFGHLRPHCSMFQALKRIQRK